MTYGEAADAAAGVGQPTTVKVCAKGNDMPGAVRKRLRTKSPDPDWCLPLNSVATQNAKRNDERSLTPARRLRQCSKSPSPSFAKQENSQDETNPTPARRLRRRSKSPSCSVAVTQCQQHKKEGSQQDSLTPARRLRQRSKSPSPSFAEQENSQQDETHPTPARRLRQCSKSPSCSVAATQRQQHKKEGFQQDSLAVSLLRTPEWRELCQKRGLGGGGSKKHLAQQLWQSANSAQKSVGGSDEFSSFTGTDSIGGQPANVQLMTD